MPPKVDRTDEQHDNDGVPLLVGAEYSSASEPMILAIENFTGRSALSRSVGSLGLVRAGGKHAKYLGTGKCEYSGGRQLEGESTQFQ